MPERPRPQRPEQTPEGKFILRIDPTPEREVELDEYGYVIADLKRVAAVAAAMFALLIGVSFFFR